LAALRRASAHTMDFRSFSRSTRRLLPIGLMLATAFMAAGCESFGRRTDAFLGVITPYRVEVVQGNVITSEQAQVVKAGMNRAQVRDVLGTPLLADVFHNDRWDYVFTLKRQGFDDQQRSFVVMFEKDKVLKIDAPELPSEDQFVASISRKKLPTSTRKLELTAEERAALPAPAVAAAPAASAVVLAGATRTYPPLESTTP
jgi:outer membrane protein assembly factor BamE